MKKLSLFLLLLGAILPNKQAAAGISGQAATQDCLAATPGSHAGQAASILVSQQAPKHEVRAVWLTTIGGRDWPHSYAQSPISARKQQEELCQILDRLQQAKINTVLLQTRVRGTMIYPSALEPWDGCLSGFPGKSPGYDALQFAIDECHKRGMELHAWVVTIPVGKWDALGCRNLRRKFPKLIRKIGTDGYMNPEDSRTGNYLAQICSEITRRYDIDGIHLDYIRYPENWNLKVSRQQGRNYITSIARKISHAVKSLKPWVKMSCSPVGKYDDLTRYPSYGWNANTKVCQDAQGWLREGLMDELFPMMYFRNEHFYPFAIDWQEQSHGKIVVPGLGIYFLDPKEGKWNIDDVIPEMHLTRNLGMGYCFFRNQFLLNNQQGILDFTRRFNEYPALVPPMTWASTQKPKQPKALDIKWRNGYMEISWQNEASYTDGTAIPTPHIYNNVYASRTYPVDVSDARNLISARRLGNMLLLKPEECEQPLYFAVTSMDGYGMESLATQEKAADVLLHRHAEGSARMLYCDGNQVHLPEITKNLDTRVFLVETLQGSTVYRATSEGNYINIKPLSPGAYRLYSVNKRGIRHALGTFFKKKFKEN